MVVHGKGTGRFDGEVFWRHGLGQSGRGDGVQLFGRRAATGGEQSDEWEKVEDGG